MIRLCGNCLGGQVPRVVMGCGHWFPTEKESWCLGEKERMEVSGKWETLVFAKRKGLCGSWTGTALCTLRPWVQRGRRRREHEPSFVVDVSQEQHETSVVSLCLRICLPMQRTWVWSLDQEDPTCQGASEPVPHTHSNLVLPFPKLPSYFKSDENPKLFITNSYYFPWLLIMDSHKQLPGWAHLILTILQRGPLGFPI